MKRSLRAGIIGLGVGEQHIEGYQRHKDCRVVALCDLDDSKRAAAREKYPDMRIVAEAEEILRDPEIDVVSIASYDNHHAEQAELGIEHGKHLFVEKPICLHPEEARRIRSALRRHPGIRISSNLILRRSPRFRWLREEIARGRFGKLYYLEADYDYGRVHKIIDGWRGKLEYYSPFLGGGVHMVDLLQWLSGDEVVEVTAYGNHIATEGTGFRFDDMVAALFRFRSGMIAKVTANFGCVHPHHHRVAVFGTEATFFNGVEQGELHTSREKGAKPELVTLDYPGYHKGDLIHGFVASILDGVPQEIGTDDVFRSLSVCFAVEASKKDGKPVKVDYI